MLTSIGTPPWTREEMLAKLDAFADLYATRPIQDNDGGMKAPHMFAFWFVLTTAGLRSAQRKRRPYPAPEHRGVCRAAARHPDATTRWGDAWSLYPTESALLQALQNAKQAVFADKAGAYNWMCYVRLQRVQRRPR